MSELAEMMFLPPQQSWISFTQSVWCSILWTELNYKYSRTLPCKKRCKIFYLNIKMYSPPPPFSSHKKPVFRIRISFHADPDPDPGSKKCPHGSGSGSGSKEVNTKEEKLQQKISTKSFKITFKKSFKINKQNINFSITKGSLLLFFQFCIHLMNLYVS